MLNERLQLLYFAIVFLGMLFAFLKVGLRKSSILIILIFWPGLFQYLGAEIHNIYKITVVFYALLLTGKKIFSVKNRKQQYVNLAFILFSISFWISYFLTGGGIITILSQYLYKYGLIFILYHYFKDITQNNIKRERLKNILLTVIFIQIFLSIVKISFFGFGVEPIVGSMSAGGAGTAVVIPIVALIFYWLIKSRKFTKTEWVIAVLFFTISLASGKRQPIVFFPLMLFALFFYVQKTTTLKALIIYLPIVLLIFYAGVRLSPTLTPENKAGGSFDVSYISDYALKYYFGVSDYDIIVNSGFDTGFGRGSGFIFFFQPQSLNLDSGTEILFGKGRYEVAAGVHGRFTATGRSDYGIEHSGLMGEAGAMLYSFGYAGTFFMLLLAIFIIRTSVNKKIALVLLLYYLWDFLFYYNQVIYSSQSAIIVLFIVFYVNSQAYISGSNSISKRLIR
ncbi:MAG: hypothetical protein ACOCUL_00785 [Bacteroidota bacterium]